MLGSPGSTLNLNNKNETALLSITEQQFATPLFYEYQPRREGDIDAETGEN
jgi:hypothetical protein